LDQGGSNFMDWHSYKLRKAQERDRGDLLRLTTAVIKIQWPKTTWRGKCLLWLHFHITVHHWWSQIRDLEARGAVELCVCMCMCVSMCVCARTCVCVAYWLAPHGLLSLLFLYTPGPPILGWTVPHQSLRQYFHKLTHRPILPKHLVNFVSLFWNHSSLFQVDIKLTSIPGGDRGRGCCDCHNLKLQKLEKARSMYLFWSLKKLIFLVSNSPFCTNLFWQLWHTSTFLELVLWGSVVPRYHPKYHHAFPRLNFNKLLYHPEQTWLHYFQWGLGLHPRNWSRSLVCCACFRMNSLTSLSCLVLCMASTFRVSLDCDNELGLRVGRKD